LRFAIFKVLSNIITNDSILNIIWPEIAWTSIKQRVLGKVSTEHKIKFYKETLLN